MVDASTTEAELLSRIIAPDEATFSADAARSIIGLEFRQPDVQRMHDLAEKNRQGQLSEVEQDEMQVYMRVGNLLSILKSKARKSLQHAEAN